MDEKALIEKIVELFKQKTMEYSEKLKAESYDTNIYYIKNDKEKGYNFIEAILEFKYFFLKMEYKVYTSMLLPTSTLEMRILFKGGKLPVEYSIYDLLNVIDESNFNCYTIPYITTEKTMEYALEYLFDAFTSYKEKIEELSCNDEDFKKLEENVQEQVNKLIGGNLFKSRNVAYIAHMLEVYYVLDAARFCTETYSDYVLSGKYKQAIKEYSRRKHKLTLYEDRLKRYISNMNETVIFLPDELRTMDIVKKYQKVGIKQSILVILTFIVLTLLWSIGYGIIYMATYSYIARSDIYTSNTELPIVVLLGVITTVINMFFAKRSVKKWIYKDKYQEYKMLDKLENAEPINNLMTKLFQFVIAGCIVVSMLAANTYIQFTDESILLNENYLSLKAQEIAYSNIDSVYKTEKILTSLGYEIESNNYVIVLKDDTKIELFWYIASEQVEDKILPLMKEKGIEIKTIDLTTNITGADETNQEQNANI